MKSGERQDKGRAEEMTRQQVDQQVRLGGPSIHLTGKGLPDPEHIEGCVEQAEIGAPRTPGPAGAINSLAILFLDFENHIQRRLIIQTQFYVGALEFLDQAASVEA